MTTEIEDAEAFLKVTNNVGSYPNSHERVLATEDSGLISYTLFFAMCTFMFKFNYLIKHVQFIPKPCFISS